MEGISHLFLHFSVMPSVLENSVSSIYQVFLVVSEMTPTSPVPTPTSIMDLFRYGWIPVGGLLVFGYENSSPAFSRKPKKCADSHGI
jgi:hypothetical protein